MIVNRIFVLGIRHTSRVTIYADMQILVKLPTLLEKLRANFFSDFGNLESHYKMVVSRSKKEHFEALSFLILSFFEETNFESTGSLQYFTVLYFLRKYQKLIKEGR